MARVATMVLRRVEFRLSGRASVDARRVSLISSFNHWDATTHCMNRDPHGDWTLTVHLPPGTYPYLFHIDGGWQNDPQDDGRTPSGWGNDYSLKIVR